MLGEGEKARIVAAIHEAEKATAGEIVVVLARASGRYRFHRLALAACAALLAPLPLILLTRLSAERIYLAQLAVFVAALAISSLRPVWTRLVPRATQDARADAMALEQFHLREVDETTTRAGVLIYCSVAERHARIVPDIAVAAKIPDAQWAGAVQALCEDAAAGRLADGCVCAVRLVGEALAHALPAREGDVNERPDAVYQI